MSASVVFASPPPVLAPVDVVCITGADGARAGCGGVGAESAGGSAPGRGGTDGTRSRAGGVGVTGLVELGLFVQASSSKPDMAAEFDLGGDCTCEIVVVVGTVGAATGLVTSGVVERAIWSETVEMASRSTAPGAVLPDLLGVGRPLRAFLSWPPGPVNRLGAPGLGVVRAEVDGSSPPRRLTSGEAAFTAGFGRRASIALLTRMISPSRKPNVRKVPSEISSRIDSSILSRSKEEE
jgi:hypothetical protein